MQRKYFYNKQGDMLKIGVLGAGHLGKIHIRLIKEIPEYELVGFYDQNPENAKKVSEELGVKAYESEAQLIDDCQVIDVVTPTIAHYQCAANALKKFKHIFIEKPITASMDEAKNLVSLAKEAGVKVQVGHVERFNPAFKASLPYLSHPMFIETHRLAQFNPRGTDVSVILDLMIHDIDIILSVVKANIKKISASGVPIVSDTPDIANARLEFDNGCVANITASRISLKNMRKMRFFQKDAYISIDFLNKASEIVKIEPDVNDDPFAISIDLGEGKGKKKIHFENLAVQESNAIKEELTTLAHSILHDTPAIVSLSDGYNALDVAYKIIEKLDASLISNGTK